MTHPLVRATAYVILSLFTACVTFGLLNSSGIFSGNHYEFGGAAAGFFLCLVILMQFDKRSFMPTTQFKELTGGYYKYNSQIVQTIKKSTRSVMLHYPMIRHSSKGRIPKEVNEAIREVAAKQAKVIIITCMEYDRISGASELNSIPNVSMFFSKHLQACDLRFTLVDGEYIVLGLNEGKELTEKYRPSNIGLFLQSVRLGQILEGHFLSIQSEASSYEQYAADVVYSYRDGNLGTTKMISQNLDISEAEVEILLKKKK
jgi:hypothetical protein